MDNLAQEINSDKNFTKEMYMTLQKELKKESAKSPKKRDYAKIERLTTEICEILDSNEEKKENLDTQLKKMHSKISEYKQEKVKYKPIRRLMPVMCCVLILFIANSISVTAWNTNIFSAVIEFSKSGFTVKFSEKEQDTIELPTSADDPFGIVSECAKYEVYPETPHYLPEGFILESIGHNVNKNHANSVTFDFFNGNQSISFSFSRYWNKVGDVGIPSDHFNLSEIEVNGSTGIVSKEDNQYTLVYEKDKIITVMFTEDVDYSECEKIVQSFK